LFKNFFLEKVPDRVLGKGFLETRGFQLLAFIPCALSSLKSNKIKN